MTPVERLLCLRELAPFRVLPPAVLRALAAQTELSEGAPGERMARQGAVVERLVVVARGALLNVEGDAVGPVLGLGGLLFERTLRTDLIAHAEEGCTLLLLSRSLVASLVHDHPGFTVALLGDARRVRLYEDLDADDGRAP